MKDRQNQHKRQRRLRKRPAHSRPTRITGRQLTAKTTKRVALLESQTTSQGDHDTGVEKKDKAIKKSGSKDNPIVIDSSSKELISLESPMGTLDISANSAPNCPASVLRQNLARPTMTEGIVPYSSSEQNSGVRTDFGAGVKDQSSPIVISSTAEAEETCLWHTNPQEWRFRRYQ